MEHCNYVYLTTCNDRQAVKDIDIMLYKLEKEAGNNSLFNIETAFDCANNVWTIRFSCLNDALPEEMEIDTGSSTQKIDEITDVNADDEEDNLEMSVW